MCTHLDAELVASITRRRNEIATGEKKYLRAAYLAAREIRISE